MRNEGAARRIPGEGEPSRRSPDRWLGFKAVIVTVLALSLIIGILIAAFSLGLIIAAILTVVALVAALVGGVSYAWRRRRAGEPQEDRTGKL